MMATEKINMPQLGESVTEGTINSWLVKVGDHVEKYDPIADVMTDKVNAEVPSSFSGIIKELVAMEGDTIAVGDLMCYIHTENKDENASSPDVKTQIVEDAGGHEAVSEKQSMKKRYSPAVLKMAQENDIDLAKVNGTGLGGRITRKDVENMITSGATPAESDAEIKHQAPSQPLQQREQIAPFYDIEIPVAGIRKQIALNMQRAASEIPHAWMMVEVDVTDLVIYRNKVKDDFKKKEGFGLTYFAFFVKAVAQALQEYPQINSMWAEDKIIQKKDINLSIAVASGEDLFVPVIKHADEKNIKRLAKDIFELATKARSGKLTADDIQGGTFTVNNTGTFGSVQSMGIINHPQAAILQVESIVKRPVIINDMFAARNMVNLCLSLDHRILDGLVCGKFLSRVKEILENTNENNTSIY